MKGRANRTQCLQDQRLGSFQSIARDQAKDIKDTERSLTDSRNSAGRRSRFWNIGMVVSLKSPIFLYTEINVPFFNSCLGPYVIEERVCSWILRQNPQSLLNFHTWFQYCWQRHNICQYCVLRQDYELYGNKRSTNLVNYWFPFGHLIFIHD